MIRVGSQSVPCAINRPAINVTLEKSWGTVLQPLLVPASVALHQSFWKRKNVFLITEPIRLNTESRSRTHTFAVYNAQTYLTTPVSLCLCLCVCVCVFLSLSLSLSFSLSISQSLSLYPLLPSRLPYGTTLSPTP